MKTSRNEKNIQDTKNEPRKGFINLLILGFFIGVAAVTPGLSGGIIAVSLGIYAYAINSVINLRRDFKNSVMFLMPLGIGALFGVFCFGVIIDPLLEKYEKYVICGFLGLIIGSMPSFFKEATKDGFKTRYLIPAITTFLLGIILSTAIFKSGTGFTLTPIVLFISGGILAAGMLIPGISSSFLLIQMGVYQQFMHQCTHFDIKAVFFACIGFITVTLLLIKLINILLKRFHGYTFFGTFGFLLSSILPVIPIVDSVKELIIALVLIVLFSTLSRLLLKTNEKN